MNPVDLALHTAANWLVRHPAIFWLAILGMVLIAGNGEHPL